MSGKGGGDGEAGRRSFVIYVLIHKPPSAVRAESRDLTKLLHPPSLTFPMSLCCLVNDVGAEWSGYSILFVNIVFDAVSQRLLNLLSWTILKIFIRY